MRLLVDDRHTVEDLERFELTRRCAEARRQSRRYSAFVTKSAESLREFAAAGPCYAGVSWGKDSVVVAHMVAAIVPHVPLVWVRVEPIYNPDCLRVRDAFLSTFASCNYSEVAVNATWSDGEWHASGTLERGFSEAKTRFGRRYISGIRGEESGQRKRRMTRFGTSSVNTCAPIGWWSHDDLWAYTLEHKLPVHPAYGLTLGGTLDPSRIRVASLGGQRGDGWGRREWEQRYYAEALQRLRAQP